MHQNNHRGKLVGVSKRWYPLSGRYGFISIGAVICASGVACLVWGFIYCSPEQFTVWWGYTAFLLSLACVSLLGVYMMIRGYCSGLIKIYEGGFIPEVVPLRYANKRERYIVYWDDVEWIEYGRGQYLIKPGYSNVELYIIWWRSPEFLKKRRGVIVSSNMFKDGWKVINKLKEVEARLKSEGKLKYPKRLERTKIEESMPP